MMKLRPRDDRERKSDRERRPNRSGLLRMLQLVAAVLLFAAMGTSQADAQQQAAVVTAGSPQTSAGSGTVTYTASVAITAPILNSEQQITSVTYTWSAGGSDTCSPSSSSSTTVTAQRSSPGPSSSSVGCTVYWYIYNNNTKQTTSVWASGSATVNFTLGVLWSPGTITGGIMTAPQNQTSSPYTPTAVVTSSGAQLTCTISGATASDTSTFSGAPSTTGNDTISYSWTASAGTLGSATSASTSWTAPTTPQTSAVTLTCTISATAPAVTSPDGGTRGPSPKSATVSVYIPVLTVDGSQSWSPTDIYVGDIVNCSAQATVTPAVPGATDNVVWQTNKTYSSADGSDPLTEFNGSEAYVYSEGSLTSDFTAAFFSPGYYMIGVQATDTLKDSSGNTLGTISGNGYVGGSAADLTGGSSASVASVTAHAVTAHASGTVKHIPVNPLSATVSVDSPGIGYHRSATGTKEINPVNQVDTIKTIGSIGMSAQYKGKWSPNSLYNWSCGPNGALSMNGGVYTTGNQTFSPPATIPSQTFDVAWDSSAGVTTDQVRFNLAQAGTAGPSVQIPIAVRLHNDYELYGPDHTHSTAQVSQYFYVHVPPPAGAIFYGQCTSGQTTNANYSWVWSFTVTATGEFNAVMGLTTTSLAKLDLGFKASFAASATVGMIAQQGIPPGKREYPMVKVTYNRVYNLIDHFDSHGFDQEASVLYSKDWQYTAFWSDPQDINDASYPYPGI